MSTGKTSRELVEELKRRNALLEARLSKLERNDSPDVSPVPTPTATPTTTPRPKRKRKGKKRNTPTAGGGDSFSSDESPLKRRLSDELGAQRQRKPDQEQTL